jgi:hypothetical protein
VQHRRRIDRGDQGVDLDQIAEAVEQRPGHLDTDPGSICVADVGECSLNLAAQVPGDAIGGLGGVERPLCTRQGTCKSVQARL